MEDEIKKIVAAYFGFKPTISSENLEINIIPGGKEKIRVKWEEHIGNLSGVARVSPLDIMYEMGWENNEENYSRAVEMLKSAAGNEGYYLVEVKGKYLLINTKYRR